MKYCQPRYPVNHTRLAGLRRKKTVSMFGRYEGVIHLEIATAGAAKPGDMPGVMNCHLLALEVADQKERPCRLLTPPLRAERKDWKLSIDGEACSI